MVRREGRDPEIGVVVGDRRGVVDRVLGVEFVDCVEGGETC
jgi:hypothetical protein